MSLVGQVHSPSVGKSVLKSGSPSDDPGSEPRNKLSPNALERGVAMDEFGCCGVGMVTVGMVSETGDCALCPDSMTSCGIDQR